MVGVQAPGSAGGRVSWHRPIPNPADSGFVSVESRRGRRSGAGLQLLQHLVYLANVSRRPPLLQGNTSFGQLLCDRLTLPTLGQLAGLGFRPL